MAADLNIFEMKMDGGKNLRQVGFPARVLHLSRAVPGDPGAGCDFDDGVFQDVF